MSDIEVVVCYCCSSFVRVTTPAILSVYMSQAVPWSGLCSLTRLRLMPVPTNANAREQHKAVSKLASVATTACLAMVRAVVLTAVSRVCLSPAAHEI